MLVLQQSYLHCILGSNSVTTEYFFYSKEKKILLRFSKTIWIFAISFPTVFSFKWVWIWIVRFFEVSPDALTGRGSTWTCGALLPVELQSCGWALWWDHIPPWCSVLPFKEATPGGKRTWMGWPVAMKKVVGSFTAPSQETATWHHCKVLLNFELAQNEMSSMNSTDHIKNLSIEGCWNFFGREWHN